MLRIACLFLAFVISLTAQESTSTAGRYRLFARDLVRCVVQGEPDVSVDRRVDGLGEIFLPLLGRIKVSGLTLAEAQAQIAKSYVDAKIFIRPEVVLLVLEYSPKEVMVLGQVSKQGKQALPAEAVSISIVEAITSAGGLTRIAKGDAVRVTRKDERGNEQSLTVDLEKMIEGRGKTGDIFFLQPGDVVFVPERVF